jgi:hypothetical protein
VPRHNADWINALSALDISEVFYLAHLDNLNSILTHGILSHTDVANRQLQHEDISEDTVQDRRHTKGLHDWVPLYFAKRTPMSSARRRLTPNLCLLAVDITKLCKQAQDICFSDGNAAAHATRIHHQASGLAQHLPLDVIRASFWRDHDDGTLRRSAELLVYPTVPARAITRIEVPTRAAQAFVEDSLRQPRLFGSWAPCCVLESSSFFF